MRTKPRRSLNQRSRDFSTCLKSSKLAINLIFKSVEKLERSAIQTQKLSNLTPLNQGLSNSKQSLSNIPLYELMIISQKINGENDLTKKFRAKSYEK